MGWFLPSHIDQGVIFGGLGAWHLANTLSSFVRTPKEFRYRTWFPVGFPGAGRYVELWAILIIVTIFICKQLSRASSDFGTGMIQMDHMQRYQHVTFALFFFIYALAGLLSESFSVLPLPEGALQATFALGFAIELLVFRLGHHPGDTLESFVHMIMQIILVLLISFMLLEMVMPRSFMVAVARCMVLILKGTWFFHIGLLINVDAFIPDGCIRGPHDYPVCDLPLAHMRARSLQVLVFGMHVAGVLVATYVSYAVLVHAHVFPVGKTHYHKLQFVEPADDLDVDHTGPVINIVPRSLSRRFSNKTISPVRKSTSPIGMPDTLNTKGFGGT